MNLDVLPLYIVLMAGFPPLLILMMRSPNAAMAASTFVYLLARHLDWNFPAYPSGGWYFNPFAWQLLFSMGAWAALGGGKRVHALVRSRTVLAASVGFVVFAFVVILAVRFHASDFVPTGLLGIFVPNDKTNLAPYRVLHFLALSVIVVHFVPRNWSGLRSRLLRPLVVCGQRSLEVFCVGIFLSFVGHFILEMFSERLVNQIAVSAGGLMLMTGVAFYRNWSRSLDAPTASATRAAFLADKPRNNHQVEKEAVT